MAAEFIALASASKEAEWLRNLMLELPLLPKPISPVAIHCDLNSALIKAYSQVYNGKSRHISLRHSLVKELINDGVISLDYVPTKMNLADCFTKAMPRHSIIFALTGIDGTSTTMNSAIMFRCARPRPMVTGRRIFPSGYDEESLNPDTMKGTGVRLIEKHPAVLNCRITSNLEPKLRFLVENGIKGLYLPRLVWVLVTSDWKRLQENLDCLIEQGVPERRIEELLVLQPRCLYQDISRIKYAVKMIRCMGVKPTDVKYIHNLRVIMSHSKLSWKRKVSVFESLGWSTEEVISTFTRTPHCLSCSEKKLRNAMDYFVNTVKVDRETIIGYPKVLTYSIEKRVVPRFTVWKILIERKLTKCTRFIWMLNISEKEFIDLYVTKYSTEIPYLLQIYMQSKGGSIRAV
ncbi:transcription termination factor MTERF2, chloroplastic-like [Chenopodium quinoa]|uniref:transcription termination factor MTERF2, chloroplastic-like n=2 Tax=Chenopodium quinoa TaxID=63459 RepID=UPI000B78E810|nr:transcription termination factor MTERF2, chloroplastic-like [Chenopodium quinoa]